jgi:hypothetical protein
MPGFEPRIHVPVQQQNQTCGWPGQAVAARRLTLRVDASVARRTAPFFIPAMTK